MNKFEHVSGLGHQMSLALGEGVPFTVRSHVQGLPGPGGPCPMRCHVQGLPGPGGPCTVRPHVQGVRWDWGKGPVQ